MELVYRQATTLLQQRLMVFDDVADANVIAAVLSEFPTLREPVNIRHDNATILEMVQKCIVALLLAMSSGAEVISAMM